MKFTVENLNSEMKISDYMKKRLGFSSSVVTKVKFGGVFVNGECVTMRKLLKNGDIIEVLFPKNDTESAPPIDIPLNVVFENEDVIVVDKPKNMPTHPSKGNNLPTLANAVSAYFGEGFVFRAVNRLDRDTSGLVIVAKNPFSAGKLGNAMKERRINKKYIALIKGIPSPAFGLICAPIERECEGSIKRTVRDDGKPALTDYKILEIHGENSLCELTLHTGRTHQIRVHMAHIGHPLIDDFLYGERSEKNDYYLRCTEISFPNPRNDEIITLKCEK